mgnify:CR=1 FL=1
MDIYFSRFTGNTEIIKMALRLFSENQYKATEIGRYLANKYGENSEIHKGFAMGLLSLI